MKLFLFLLVTVLLILILSVPSNAQNSITITVSNVAKKENVSEVIGRYKYYWYKARCKDLSDTVRVGVKLIALPTRQPDSCKCVFKRFK